MYQDKKSWILYFFIFLLLVSFVSADDINISEPMQDEYYTIGILDLNLQVSGVGYTWCYYYFNFSTRPRNISCYDLTEKVSVPKDGTIILTVVYNQTTSQINETISFTVDRDLSTGKGFILFGLIMFPMLIVFLLMWVGHRLDKEQKPLKYFLYLSSLVFVFVSFYVNMFIIENYVRSDALMDALNTRVYGWIFYIILTYFFVYWTLKLLMYMQQQKRDKLEY